MAEWNGCYCGEFAQPTIAPDEFGETCFHERDKCEVSVPDPVPIETVLRLTRARAEKAEAAIKRVRGICEVIVENAHQFYEVWDEDPTAAQVPYGQWMVARHILRALEGESEQ